MWCGCLPMSKSQEVCYNSQKKKGQMHTIFYSFSRSSPCLSLLKTKIVSGRVNCLVVG